MRKIEQQMLAALKARKDFNLANTSVYFIGASESGNPHGSRSEVFLHGNHIADYWHHTGTLEVDTRTLARWPSNTTKSRLRALGAHVTTKNYRTYLDGQLVA